MSEHYLRGYKDGYAQRELDDAGVTDPDELPEIPFPSITEMLGSVRFSNLINAGYTSDGIWQLATREWLDWIAEPEEESQK